MQINPRSYEAYKLLHDGTFALSRAEQAGIRVDIDYVRREKKKIEDKRKEIEEQFRATDFFKHWQHTVRGEINTSSGLQLGKFLYDVKKLEPAYKTEGTERGSTDEEALRALGIPELDLLLEKIRYKKPWDVLNGFEKEEVDGYIHPFFNLNLAVTYRSSSDSPNFQNIPVRDEEVMNLCRGAMYARPGHQLMEIDTSGMEVRISACYHKDQKFIYDVIEGDMHGDMANEIFMMNGFNKKDKTHDKLRKATKNGFVFPQFYGSYYKNCAVNLACTWGKLSKGKWKPGQGIPYEKETLADHLISKGIRSLEDFTEHLKKIEDSFWNERYIEYTAWKDSWYAIYKRYGYIDLKTGFRCGGVMDRKNVINYPIQGSAFHCLLWSFIQCDLRQQKENWDTRLVGQIHDSMVLDVHPDEVEHVYKTVKKIMCKELPEAWKWIIVPIDVDAEITPVDGSWAEKKKLVLN